MNQLLRDPNLYPGEDVLQAALGGSAPAWKAFLARLDACGLTLEWRFYDDGKAWLAKGQAKKKTVFWGSVWEGSFRTTFFFPAAAAPDLDALGIAKDAQKAVTIAPPVGKSIPFLVEVRGEDDLAAAYALLEYKRGLK